MPNKKGRKPLTPEKTAERRESIVRAANKLFAENGYENISIRRLADEINMSHMSIYKFFKNKRTILIHLWEEIFQTLFTKCRNAADRGCNPAQQIKNYANCFVNYWIANPQNYLMVYGQIDMPSRSESFFADSPLILEELDFLSQLLIQADVAPQKVEICCQQYLCALHGICHSIITIPELQWQAPSALVEGLVQGIIDQNK